MTVWLDRGYALRLARSTGITALPAIAAILLAASASSARAAPEPGPISEEKPVVLPLARQFDFRAKSGLEYRIFVAAPEGPAPAEGFPVLYLLDANINFSAVLAAARKQSREALPAVVVGIGYPTDSLPEQVARRAFDLTPPTSETWQETAPGPMRAFKTGGNDQFLDFIESELKPFIERRHPINRARQALFGHSFGGLFTLHVLFQRPESFQVYLASSPSLWWNDSSVLGEAESFLQSHAGRDVPARVLISLGENERKPTSSERPGPRPDSTALADSAEELAARLNAADVPGLSVLFRAFPEEDHGSVVLPAASRGARLLLEAGGKARVPPRRD